MILNFKKKFKEYFFENHVNCFLILCFLLPFILYEMIPTKLPHYIFPAYATLSILVAKEIIMRKFSPNLLNYSLLPAIIFPLTILSIITFAIYEYSSFDTEFFFIIIILLFLLFYLIYFLKKKVKKKFLF